MLLSIILIVLVSSRNPLLFLPSANICHHPEGSLFPLARVRFAPGTGGCSASLSSAAPGSASRAWEARGALPGSAALSAHYFSSWHQSLLLFSWVIPPGAGGWWEQPRPPKEGCCGSPLGARSVPGASPAVNQPRGAGPRPGKR